MMGDAVPNEGDGVGQIRKPYFKGAVPLCNQEKNKWHTPINVNRIS